ncbi:MAG: ISAs1 family transposase [Planctomycetota bacterium]
MKRTPRLPSEEEQKLVEDVHVRPIRSDERARFMKLLERHHYLGELKPVGEQVLYVAVGENGGWRALLVFCAAANHLRHRDQWIGWTDEQRRRRLALVANNARFLILPGYAVPNMGTRVMKLALDRVSDDWRQRYSHPLAAVETFVDPAKFQGTVYKAGGWVELGLTRGCGRVGRDYYERHNKPKRLFVRELCRNARRGLQAEHLKPAWASVEEKVSPRCTQKAKEIRSLAEHFKTIPDFRSRIQSYPVWSLVTMVALAYLCEAPRGPKDLAKFARDMSRGQRRALGIRRNRQRKFPAPSQSTFTRLLNAVDARAVETAILAFQAQVRGPVPKDEMVAMDGKAAQRSGGEMLLTAVSVPGLHYLGSEPVPVDKTNEIPVARAMFERLDLVGRLVGLDALHTQMETACRIVQGGGADYLFTVKGNQKGLRRTLRTRFTATVAAFSPSTHDLDVCLDRRDESQPTGTAADSHAGGNT